MEGFEVAGSDKVFYPAKAEVYNNLQIKVTCDKVPDPVAVRYCFRDFQPGNVAGTRECPCSRSVRITGEYECANVAMC